MAEPLSVVLHAALRAGELLGKRVLVTGCGPIGALAILVARRAGAAEIVATDLARTRWRTRARSGPTGWSTWRREPEALAAFGADKGTFDVLFECSGAAAALAAGVGAMRPRGVSCSSASAAT